MKKLGSREELVNMAWEQWVKVHGPNHLEELMAGIEAPTITEQLELAWKLGFWTALLAYENKAMGQIGRG